jgi:polar amino acid transport system substrate-binding protein
MIVEDFQFAQDESTLGTRIGMPKGEKELTDAVNAIIDELRASGQYDKWYDEYTAYARSLGID